METKQEAFVSTSEALRDPKGRPMFLCGTCGLPLSAHDVTGQGLRLPGPDESRDEYLDAELIDSLQHPACLSERRAG
jgi:hypothetical protein